MTDPIGNAGQAPCQTAANCTVSFQYDTGGNLTCVTSVLGHPDTTTQTLTESLFYTDGHPGDLTAIANPRGTGGACLTSPPANDTTSYSYDTYGNLTQVTDPMGDSTTASYDSLGRPVSVVEPPGNASGGTPFQYTDTLAYDAFGELTSYKDVLGH